MAILLFLSRVLSIKVTLLIFVTTLYFVVEANDMEHPVYFSLIISGGENGYRSAGGVPSVDLALKYIEEKQLLPNYNLTYASIRNSKCTRTDSLNELFSDLSAEAVTKIAVVGCGCSTATEPVAEVSHYWNVTQISFAAALSSLSDRSRFRNYFRTTPSFGNYASTILGILNKFRWRQLAFITQQTNLFLKIESDLDVLIDNLRKGESSLCCFENHDIHVDSAKFEDNGDPVAAAKKIFDQRQFHVFMLNCYSKNARKIICEASKRNLVYPHYGWIMFGWYPERWWTEEVAGEHIDECSDEELGKFVEKSRSLVINLFPEPDNYTQETDAGISTNQFIEEYKKKLDELEYNISTCYIVAFDTIWSIALALKYTEDMRLNDTKVEKCSHLDGELVALDMFNYSNAFMGCVIKENFHKVDFTGVSGPVRYDETGTIVYTRIRLAQNRVNKDGTVSGTRFGFLDRDSNFTLVYETGESDKTLYPDGFPPDGTPVIVIMTYHRGLVISYYILAASGIIVSAVLLLFNYIFRKTKIIRLTTPLLSYFIICGSFLMFVSVFFGLLQTTEEAAIRAQCTVHVWIYGIGYFLVYGTVLAKMLRVYQIFHNPNPNKSIPQTWHLVGIVGGVTAVGALLIMARTIAQILVDPHLVVNLEDPEGKTASDTREDNKVWQCYDTGSAPFYLDLIMFIYLGLLQVVGIILAFQTRKVKISVLNESKAVTALIYISSMVLVVIVLTTFILNGYANTRAALFCGGIILLASIFLAFIFIPKMIGLYRDPKGEGIFSDLDPSKRTEKSVVKESQAEKVINLTELSDSEKVVLLQSQVERLKETVSDQKKRLTELECA